MKSQIVERLEQADILLPSLIEEGLTANDRAKARLTVLQAAARHARDPRGVRFSLVNECRVAGIDPLAHGNAGQRRRAFSVERGSRRPASASSSPPIWDDVSAMIRAVSRGETTEGDAALARLSAQRAAVSPVAARYRRAFADCQADCNNGWRRRQPASPGHGSAQGAQRSRRGACGRDIRGRACLRADAGGPPGGRSVHARRRSDTQAEIRSPRTCDDGGAVGRRGSPSKTTSAKPMRMSS